MADQPLNPYASPQNLDALLQAGKPGGPQYARPYQSARGRAKWAVGTSIAALVLQVVLLVSCAMQLAMLYSAQQGVGLGEGFASWNDARQLAVSVAAGIAEVAALIALLFWVYAAHANLPALGNAHLDFTSGWAVGWFFVPIANLFKPHQIVSEIWRGSDPAVLRAAMPSGTALVSWWWWWRVLSAIVERIMTAIQGETKSVDGFIGLTWFIIGLIVVLDIPMLIFQILVVRRVQGWQDARFALVTNQHPPGDFRDPLAAIST
jgi:hypothetical protein